MAAQGRASARRTVARRAAGRCAGARAARRRWSCGCCLDALARRDRVAAGMISSWREELLAAGREGLKSRPAPVEDRRLAEAQRKIGELSMDLDILRALNDGMDRRPRSPRR